MLSTVLTSSGFHFGFLFHSPLLCSLFCFTITFTNILIRIWYDIKIYIICSLISVALHDSIHKGNDAKMNKNCKVIMRIDDGGRCNNLTSATRDASQSYYKHILIILLGVYSLLSGGYGEI